MDKDVAVDVALVRLTMPLPCRCHYEETDGRTGGVSGGVSGGDPTPLEDSHDPVAVTVAVTVAPQRAARSGVERTGGDGAPPRLAALASPRLAEYLVNTLAELDMGIYIL